MRDNVLAARLELVAALAVAPHLRDALLELARLHCGTGRAIDALPILVAHLNRAPTDTDALALLADALVRVGRSSDARLALARALRQDSSHAEALQLDATLRSRRDDAFPSQQDITLPAVHAASVELLETVLTGESS